MSALEHVAAVDIAEALDLFDSGRSVFTIEMGGLGPGYEQALQVAVFEIARKVLDAGLSIDETAALEQLDAAAHAVNKEHDLGLSGAQASAAKWLACKYVRDGYRATLELVSATERDRLIQVDNSWKRVTS